MESAVYAAEAETEKDHWWFVGRRKLFGRLIRTLKLSANARALDAGTSTGANLRLLRDLGIARIEGIDISPEAQHYCAYKQLGAVTLGDICSMPYAAEQFDLVMATDVLEHLDDDRRALAEIQRVLRFGGHVLITVPAFPSLWGLQDQVAHHRRRYRQRPLLKLLQDSGLHCERTFHFNYLLFGPIWLARQVIRLSRLNVRSENDVNTRWLNRLLSWVFAADIWSARWLRPPFGVSILVLATKQPASAGKDRRHVA